MQIYKLISCLIFTLSSSFGLAQEQCDRLFLESNLKNELKFLPQNSALSNEEPELTFSNAERAALKKIKQKNVKVI